MAQTVTVAAHAILQTSGLKAPLAAEPAIIFRAFSFASLGHAGRTEQNCQNDKRNCMKALHRLDPPEVCSARLASGVYLGEQPFATWVYFGKIGEDHREPNPKRVEGEESA